MGSVEDLTEPIEEDGAARGILLFASLESDVASTPQLWRAARRSPRRITFFEVENFSDDFSKGDSPPMGRADLRGARFRRYGFCSRVMKDCQSTRFLQGAAVGSLIAAAALVVILVVPAPLGTDHFAILTGLAALSQAQRHAYQHYIAVNFSFDNIYLTGHIAMWLGLASLTRRRLPLLALAILFYGVGGATLDFLENALRWTYAKDLVRGVVIDAPAMRTWSVIYNLSYTAIFVAAPLAALGALGAKRWGGLVVGLALLGVALLPGSYFEGYDFTYYWLIVWHVVAAVYLWTSGSQLSSQSTVQSKLAPAEGI